MHACARAHTLTHTPQSVNSWVLLCNIPSRQPHLLSQGALTHHREHSLGSWLLICTQQASTTLACSSLISSTADDNVTSTVGLFGFQSLLFFTVPLHRHSAHKHTGNMYAYSSPSCPSCPLCTLGKLSLHIHVCMPTSPLTQCSPLCAPHQPSAHTEYGCPSFLANIQLSPPTAGGSSKGSSRPLGLRSQFPARQLGEGTLSKAPLPGLRQSWPQSKTYWLPPPTRGPTCHPCLPRNRTGTGNSSGKSPGGGQEAALNLIGHRRLIEPIS